MTTRAGLGRIERVEAPADTKTCPFCGETIKAAAIKCRYCAERLDGTPAPETGAPAAAEAVAPPASASRAAEQELWGGTGAQWLNLGHYAVAFLIASGSMALFIMADGAVLAIVGGGLLATALVVTIKVYVDVAFRRYSVTSRRIQVESGWLSKRIDQIDLMRIRDVELRQGILQRLFGIGHIHVVARDASDPHFSLRGIPEPRKVYDVIQRQALDTVRSRGHVQVNT